MVKRDSEDGCTYGGKVKNVWGNEMMEPCAGMVGMAGLRSGVTWVWDGYLKI